MGPAKKNIEPQLRRNQAVEKAKRLQAKLRLVKYRVENGDILILSGPYNGQLVTQLWARGDNERDYIVKNLCMRNDPEVLAVIRGLCGH